MIKTIQNFKNSNFYEATATLFKKLNIAINEITTLSIDKNELFEKQVVALQSIKTIYAMGMIDDAFFKKSETKLDTTDKKRYEGILIFAVELNEDKPTRKTLADISRAFNREYHYTPVIVLFKYGNHISLSNTQRQEYKENQKYRGGEKAGKVTILRDIDIDNPHRGHIDILNKMQISNNIDSYEKLYTYWQEVFDVSILNKKFYQELFKWYTDTLDTIKLPNDDGSHAITTTNTIRLITRIMFIWFLKEKGVVPYKLFDKKYLDEILEYSDENNSTYYKVILQNLFFATLNTEILKRKFRATDSFHGKNRDYGNQDVYRYERFIKLSRLEECKALFSQIPFVNGGLFENLDIVSKNKIVPTQRVDGFSDRKDNKLIVPDEIFFGDAGLITILNSYKFTIAENTPIEEDVALDPELLGKVFENLLASYNPETNTTTRHDTGSYYTPREIVGYMVDSTLINHFKKVLEDDFEDKDELGKQLHILLSYEDEKQPFEAYIVDKLIVSIDNLKILDPAVGSGAYPMGILQKMVHLLHKLDPNNEKWKQKQLDKIDDDILRDEIKEVFDKNNNELDYGRKLYLIENTIFGIDIQNIAIQIAKLRFFISLIVDQNVNKDKKNLGIRPLPNLEFKLMQGNSLLETINGFDPLDETDKIKNKNNKTRIQNLKKNFHKFYKASSKIDKEKIKFEIKSDIDELFRKVLINEEKELQKIIKENDVLNTSKVVQKKHQQQLANKTLIQKILSEYEEFDATTELFLYKIYFAEVFASGGFDIVIGNPPYIRQEKLKELKPKLQLERDKFLSYNGTADIYIYFFEKGYKLLKPNGILSYITSNKYTRARYGKEFRKFVLDNTNVLEYVDFNGVKVFESATVDTSIMTYKKVSHSVLDTESKNNFTYTKVDEKYKKGEELKEFVDNKGFEYSQSDLSEDSFSFASPQELRIKKQIEKIGTPLKDWDIKISYGIKTGFNEAFIIDTKIKDELIAKDSKSTEIIKPLLRGRDINKYGYNFHEQWVLAIKYNSSDNIIKKYPNVFEWLSKFEQRLKEKAQVIRGDHHWLELDNNPTSITFMEFENEKIIYPNMATEFIAYYDDKGFYTNQKCFTISGVDLKYLTAILNSKVNFYYFRLIGAKLGSGGYEMSKIFVKKLPIPKIPKEQQKPFEILVDYILFAKEQKMNNEASQFEAVIDGMVYDLYFEDDMKKADCFISDAIRGIELQPFDDSMSIDFRQIYVQTVYDVFKNTKTIQRGLIFSRNIEAIKIIDGR